MILYLNMLVLKIIMLVVFVILTATSSENWIQGCCDWAKIYQIPMEMALRYRYRCRDENYWDLSIEIQKKSSKFEIISLCTYYAARSDIFLHSL
jgi:hypothetical protein